MSENYNLLLERISIHSGVDKIEIEKKIETKRSKLSGLISREGAAQIIAAELGVKFDNVQLKISELVAGMRKINVVGKIISIFPVRSFEKNSRSGKVSNFIIADETGNSRVVLWDINHISLIENKELVEGGVVQIINASTKEGEIHLSSFSEIKKSNTEIKNVKIEKNFTETKIEEIKENSNISIRGIVVQIFEPRFFSVCPSCKKKAIADMEGFSCIEHGKIIPSERALLNFVVDDGTDNVRVVLFSDQLEKLISIEKLKNGVSFNEFKMDLLGTDITIRGLVKKNALFSNLEITGNEIEKTDPSILAEILEKTNQ